MQEETLVGTRWSGTRRETLQEQVSTGRKCLFDCQSRELNSGLFGKKWRGYRYTTAQQFCNEITEPV